MTTSTAPAAVADGAPAAPRHAGAAPRRAGARRWSALNTVVVLCALLGGGVLAYPGAATWFSDRAHRVENDLYLDAATGLDPAERDRILDAAHEYNDNLPLGPLRDPYVLNASGEAVSLDEGRADYQRQLVLGDAAPMARLTVPAIGVDLPIYHGTDDATLARGVGHLYGSALPVGGTGTHAVLTAHSGFVQATLFDDLHRLDVGDHIVVTVLGEEVVYRVDQTLVTLPDESEPLRQVPGHDYLTLITCTPTGVNTHRLLVRGERIDTRASDAPDGQLLLAATAGPGAPWWIALGLAPGLVTTLMLQPTNRGKRPRTRRAHRR